MAQRLIAHPLFEDLVIISDDLLTIKRRKWRVHLKNPIYTGAAVLDMSKLLMYRFVYDFLKPKFGNSARILYTGVCVSEIENNLVLVSIMGVGVWA